MLFKGRVILSAKQKESLLANGIGMGGPCAREVVTEQDRRRTVLPFRPHALPLRPCARAVRDSSAPPGSACVHHIWVAVIPRPLPPSPPLLLPLVFFPVSKTSAFLFSPSLFYSLFTFWLLKSGQACSIFCVWLI